MSHDHDSWYIDATSCTCMKYELLHLPGTVVLPPLWNWVYFGTKIPKRVGYSDPAKFVQQLNDLQILWMERSAEIWKLQTIFLRGFWVQYCIPIPTESKWEKKVNKEKKLNWVYLRPRPSSTSNPLLLAAADRWAASPDCALFIGSPNRKARTSALFMDGGGGDGTALSCHGHLRWHSGICHGFSDPVSSPVLNPHPYIFSVWCAIFLSLVLSFPLWSSIQCTTGSCRDWI